MHVVLPSRPTDSKYHHLLNLWSVQVTIIYFNQKNYLLDRNPMIKRSTQTCLTLSILWPCLNEVFATYFLVPFILTSLHFQMSTNSAFKSLNGKTICKQLGNGQQGAYERETDFNDNKRNSVQPFQFYYVIYVSLKAT